LRSQAVASRVEAARQSEFLKSLLLDALAHDFTTPLTSIKGAITTVRSSYSHDAEEDDLLAVVEEETDKLNGMVDETIDMARIESGRIQLRRRQLTVDDLIHTCLNRMSSLLDGRPIDIGLQPNISRISADSELLGLALRQIVGNAIKYSPAPARGIGFGTPATIHCPDWRSHSLVAHAGGSCWPMAPGKRSSGHTRREAVAR
jgi:two-component system sensor histidine kinase KdpD